MATLESTVVLAFEPLVRVTPTLQLAEATHRERFESVFRLPAFEQNTLHDRRTGAATRVPSRPTLRLDSAIQLALGTVRFIHVGLRNEYASRFLAAR